MANFRTHTAWAVSVGAATAGLAWYGWGGTDAGVGWDALSLAVVVATIGGVVPDLDHDTGTGLAEVSALLTTVLPVVTGAALADQGVAVWRSWGLLALLPAYAGLQWLFRRQEHLGARSGIFAALRAVCVSALCALGFTLAVPGELALPGYGVVKGPGACWLLMVVLATAIQLCVPVFKRLTVHRGVFHTVPAVVCYALACVAFFSAFAPLERVIIGVAAFLGGMSHLILDEIYAVDFDGVRLTTRRSFGSAVSFWKERYPAASMGVYLLLGALVAALVVQATRWPSAAMDGF